MSCVFCVVLVGSGKRRRGQAFPACGIVPGAHAALMFLQLDSNWVRGQCVSRGFPKHVAWRVHPRSHLLLCGWRPWLLVPASKRASCEDTFAGAGPYPAPKAQQGAGIWGSDPGHRPFPRKLTEGTRTRARPRLQSPD